MDYPRILGESFFYFPFQINSFSSKNEIHGRVFRIGGDPLSPKHVLLPETKRSEGAFEKPIPS